MVNSGKVLNKGWLASKSADTAVVDSELTVTWPGIKSTSYPPHISATSLLISLVTDVVTIITKIVGSGRGEKRKRWFIWRRRRVEFWRRDLEGVGEGWSWRLGSIYDQCNQSTFFIL